MLIPLRSSLAILCYRLKTCDRKRDNESWSRFERREDVVPKLTASNSIRRFEVDIHDLSKEPERGRGPKRQRVVVSK